MDYKFNLAYRDDTKGDWNVLVKYDHFFCARRALDTLQEKFPRTNWRIFEPVA